MTCYSGFGNLAEGNHNFWTGSFDGRGRTQILFYYRGDDNWWLGTDNGNGIDWQFVGNTAGFGHAITDGRPFWTGRFSTSDREQILFYYPGDDNWWLGTISNGALTWQLVGNTAGFGRGINDGRPFWIGDFTGNGLSDVLFYYPGDDNWWLGSMSGGQLNWTLAGNTAGFGHGINDGRPFWTGRFSTSGRDQIAFYYPGDGNWWLGTHDGNVLQWSFAGNTNNFGQIWDGRPFWIGDFTGDSRSDVLFYFPGDDNWWLGSHDGNAFTWRFAGNTAGFGQRINDGWPFWIGRFSRSDRDQVLFYFPGDGNWWLGSDDGNILQWSFAGNTNNFGQVWDGRPFWMADLNGDDRAEPVFYFPGDGNWWAGAYGTNAFDWRFLGNTGRPCSQSARIHYKSLLPITAAINSFFDTQHDATERLFSEGGVAVYRGTTEDLSGNTALAAFLTLDVGGCFLGQPTAEHDQLFQNRNDAGADDVVVYLTQSLVNGTTATTLLGCATHPDDLPGLAVVQSGARWLLAHELGHVLGLRHVATSPATNSDFLMFPNVGWTNVPPDVTTAEYQTMLDSEFTAAC
jgi:hypothetical protein